MAHSTGSGKVCRECGGEVPAYNVRHRIYFCRPCKVARDRRHTTKYNRTDKHRAAQMRYRATPKGRAALQREQRRRVRIRDRTVGYAATEAQARAINAYITQRYAAFRAEQPKGGAC